MNPARVSVIINNYNYARYLTECIESVLQQSRPADEIIVVDDGSTDESLKVLSSFRPQIKVIEQENQGQFSAIHRGLQEATGDIILFLDSDDKWRERHIETVLRGFKRRPKVDFVTTCIDCFGTVNGEHHLNKNIVPKGYIQTSEMLAFDRKRFVGMSTSACACKRQLALEVFDKCETLRDEFRACADQVLVVGTSTLGAAKFLMKNRTVLYRTHDSNAFFEKNISTSDEHKTRRRKLINHLRKASGVKLLPKTVMIEAAINLHHRSLRPSYFALFKRAVEKTESPAELLQSYPWKIRTKRIKLKLGPIVDKFR